MKKTLGLTTADVRERIRRGQTNTGHQKTSRTYGEIIRANVFTLLNGIILALLILVVVFGSYKDALFGFILVANSLIGIVQEIRAKKVLDKLALSNTPSVTVFRNNHTIELPIHEIVLDDVIQLKRGDHVVVDGTVLEAEELELDESLLSGESVPVKKKKGNRVLSGSFVTAGMGHIRATKVGSDTYAQLLIKEAQRFELTHSELRIGVDKLLKYVLVTMAIIGPIILVTQFTASRTLLAAVPSIVGAFEGMIPQGLVLLVSIAFAASVINLGRQKVLVQELSAVESLARVDTVCFDKTGTLTTGAIKVHSVEKVSATLSNKIIREVFEAIGDVSSKDTILGAIAKAFHRKNKPASHAVVPFSSERKWSATHVENRGIWILGAPEILLQNSGVHGEELLSKASKWSNSGFRVLLLGHTKSQIHNSTLPSDFVPAAFLVLMEEIRRDAHTTLKFFKKEGVNIKIISGDNTQTVAAIAAHTGIAVTEKPLDATRLPNNPTSLQSTMEQYNIFGRVSPQQKRDMIKALRKNGHVVAMIGDGVNDILAIKAADLGIAMGNGAHATKDIAKIVLLENNFATLPVIVAEGRQVMANIERVANLFITKTVFITMLAALAALLFFQFPFFPRHVTLIDTLTIGIPAFFLALAPNYERYQPGFLRRVLFFVIPTGTLAAFAVLLSIVITRAQSETTPSHILTAAFMTLGIIELGVLGIFSQPLRSWRLALFLTMAGILALSLFLPKSQKFFGFEFPSLELSLLTMAIGILCLILLWFLLKFLKRYNRILAA